jgi:hypothetical protein
MRSLNPFRKKSVQEEKTKDSAPLNELTIGDWNLEDEIWHQA